MRIDGLYIQLGPISINWDLWKTIIEYEATESRGPVRIEEQQRKFWPKRRRLIHYQNGHEGLDDSDTP